MVPVLDPQPAVDPPASWSPISHLNDAMVSVQSDWNGWRTAMARVGDLDDVHWRQPPGAPRPLIHAIISCDRFHSGELDHQCGLTGAPHRLLVCILKSHTALPIFEQLCARADSADTASLRVAFRQTAVCD